MPTVAMRRALLTGTRSYPFRDWEAAPKLPQFPGWSPIPAHKRLFTEFMELAGVETAYVTDNPFLIGPRFERFRQALDISTLSGRRTRGKPNGTNTRSATAAKWMQSPQRFAMRDNRDSVNSRVNSPRRSPRPSDRGPLPWRRRTSAPRAAGHRPLTRAPGRGRTRRGPRVSRDSRRRSSQRYGTAPTCSVGIRGPRSSSHGEAGSLRRHPLR
jgi:hypothetical protein